MTLTKNSSIICDFLIDLLKNDDGLHLEDVFYGDQALIPRVPAACVETKDVTEAPSDAGIATDIAFEIYIMVYHSSADGVEVTRRNTDQYAEQIRDVLNGNRQLRNTEDPSDTGLVVHGWVSDIEYGYAPRGKTLYRAARITYAAVTRGRVV